MSQLFSYLANFGDDVGDTEGDGQGDIRLGGTGGGRSRCITIGESNGELLV